MPAAYQHKALFWGVIGALLMRMIFIFAGIALIEKFHSIIYLFAAFLIFTGVKMMIQKDKKINPDKNPVVRLFKKIFPVTDTLRKLFFLLLSIKKLLQHHCLLLY